MQRTENSVLVTALTKAKVEAAKQYIERRYSKLIQLERDKKENWQLLYEKMQALNFSQRQQEIIKQQILSKEAEALRQNRQKPSFNDYECIKTIGKGAFGEVRLCRNRETDEPVAIKRMKKSHMISKNKVMQAREEKEILSNSINNPWIVQLKCSFQDENYLYLVMEYVPGGDMMGLLIKKDIFSEDETRFYVAETLLALQSVHNMGYIHRDLKPDNILIDETGHLKLSDFGLCKNNEQRPTRLDEYYGKTRDCRSQSPRFIGKSPTHRLSHKPFTRNRKLAYSAVGTPDYVAPEVQSKTGYNETADWWSLGVIMFEMLVGYPPFYSEDSSETWLKILNWRKYFTIPKESRLSPVATDLIRRLVCDQRDRLGNRDVWQIKNHPFFTGVDWNNIRKTKAPNIPSIRRPFDTSYFQQFQIGPDWSQQEPVSKKKGRKQCLFIGYTFKPGQQSELVKALVDLESLQTQNGIQTRRKSKRQYERLQTEMIQSKNGFKKQKIQNVAANIQQVKESLARTITQWMGKGRVTEQQLRSTKKPTPACTNRSPFQELAQHKAPAGNKSPTNKASLKFKH